LVTCVFREIARQGLVNALIVEVESSGKADPIRSLASSARLMIAQTGRHYRVIEKLGGAAKKVYIMSVRCLTQSPRGTARV